MNDYGHIAHDAYEAAAQSGPVTQPTSPVPWKDVPPEIQAATTAAANAVARAEREAIAEWLRSKEEMVEVYTDTDGENSWRILSGSQVADAIERGEHLRCGMVDEPNISWRELRGYMPDITDGLPISDYLEGLRGSAHTEQSRGDDE